MASSYSSSLPRTWSYNVFTSFHGPDVRKKFLSILRNELSFYGISMFDDQGIERGQTIAPALTQAIRESRISIVVLSKNYASSSWCLDELVEILKCREELGQIVMTVFYEVDPSDVRKQTGDFGRVFNETCARKTEVERRRWSQALNLAGTIAGEVSHQWDNEVHLIDKIANDISYKLNVLPNKAIENMVGIEAHLHKMESLLQLDSDVGVKIVGISGPTGIGKTTIARALHSMFSNRFQHTCFMKNLKGSYSSVLSDYRLKLRLQNKLLSKIFNRKDIRVYYLGKIQARLFNLKVFIILDDVDDLIQLETLVNDTAWFGPGSRIIVTTKDQELLRQHGIDDTYHVDFPSTEESLEIFCKNAFRQSSPSEGFKELANRVAGLCGNLPSRLRMVGSSLRGKNQEEWEEYEQSLSNKRKGKKSRYSNEQSLSNKRKGKKSWYSNGMTFLLVINLLMEIASAAIDQLSFIRQPYLARISLVMSVLSVVLSILDLAYKIQAHKACFQCKWPIPWFYYPSRDNIIFGSFTETVLLFCAVGHLVVSGINYSYIEKRQAGPIKVIVWPLFFAIGMVISKFMEKPTNSVDILPVTRMY